MKYKSNFEKKILLQVFEVNFCCQVYESLPWVNITVLVLFPWNTTCANRNKFNALSGCESGNRGKHTQAQGLRLDRQPEVNLLKKYSHARHLEWVGACHRFPLHSVMPIINDKSAGKHTRIYK